MSGPNADHLPKLLAYRVKVSPTRDGIVQEKAQKSTNEHACGQQHLDDLVQLKNPWRGDKSDKDSQGYRAPQVLPLEWSQSRGWRITCLDLLRVLVHPVGNGEPTEDGEAEDKQVPG